MPRYDAPRKMTRRADDLLVAGTLVISIVFFRCAAAVAATEYVRPPPGRVIFTEHTKPASHPQQVYYVHKCEFLRMRSIFV